jgi:hypothetical protein
MEQNNSDQIDLTQMLNALKKGLVRFIVLLFNAWNFIIKKWIIVISLLIIGVLLGYFLQSNYKPNKKTEVLLKVNFDAVAYLYKEVELINNKIEQKDSIFISNLGLSTDSTEVRSLEVTPIVNLNDVVSKYGADNSRTLESLLENVEFEGEELILTETFISDYKYHTISFKLSNNATLQSVSNIIKYFNSNELLEKVRDNKTENLNNRIIYNKKIITQIDDLIETYNSNKSMSSSSNEIFVVDKNFNMAQILNKKIELHKENEYLRKDLIYLQEIVVIINKPQLFEVEKKFKNNKMIYYPFLFVAIFLFFAFIKHSYNYLKQLAENTNI